MGRKWKMGGDTKYGVKGEVLGGKCGFYQQNLTF